jgi:hypothetical protein
MVQIVIQDIGIPTILLREKEGVRREREGDKKGVGGGEGGSDPSPLSSPLHPDHFTH